MRIHDADGVQRPPPRRANDAGHHALARSRRRHERAALFRRVRTGNVGGRSSMSQVVIENPIINSPFDEPTRHFRFSDEGITDEIGDGLRRRRGGCSR